MGYQPRSPAPLGRVLLTLLGVAGVYLVAQIGLIGLVEWAGRG